jgi:nuclear polyadenylated RNA-binding protein 3
MTDNPELVATADLTPESPKPINLSSPADVPALQDQADSLSTIALSPSEDVTTAGSTSMNNLLTGEAGDDQSHAEPVGDASPSDTSPTSISDASDHSHGAQEHALVSEVQNEVEDDYAKDFDSPISVADDTGQDAVSKADDIPVNNGTVNSGSHQNPPSAEEVTSASQPTPVSAPGDDSVTNSNPQASSAIATTSVTDMAPEDVSTVESHAEPQPKPEDAIDIQALVDNITARNAAAEPTDMAATGVSEIPSGTVQSIHPQSSLPPKPPASQQPSAVDARSDELLRFQPTVPSAVPGLSPPTGLPYAHPPGSTAAAGNYAPPPMYPNTGIPMPLASQYQTAPPPGTSQNFNQLQRYEDFLKEERKYVSEAKWDRFPENSRLFIGEFSAII